MRHLIGLSISALGILLGTSTDALAGVAIHVPEPSTLALLGAGLGAAAILKFWRAK
jgi:PEP-CTERM motif